MQRYLKTKEAMEYLSVSKSFLLDNMGKIFEEGVHYYQPADARLLRWDVYALDGWMQGVEIAKLSLENSEILQQLF